MKRITQETHLPNGMTGEIKLDSSKLDVSERYWVMMTAHNEKLSSRVAKVDFEPMDPAGNLNSQAQPVPKSIQIEINPRVESISIARRETFVKLFLNQYTSMVIFIVQKIGY